MRPVERERSRAQRSLDCFLPVFTLLSLSPSGERRVTQGNARSMEKETPEIRLIKGKHSNEGNAPFFIDFRETLRLGFVLKGD
jgi:hypothetical protein